MEYIVIGRGTMQVSQEVWERLTLSCIISETLTVAEIFKWAAANKIDPDTIQILPNTLNK